MEGDTVLRKGQFFELKLRPGARAIWVGVAVLYLCILPLIVTALYQSRSEAFYSAQNISNNMSRAFEQNLEAVINQVDLGIISIIDEIELQQSSGVNEPEKLVTEIAEQDIHSQDVLGFHVYNSTGSLIYGLNGVSNPAENISGREYFQNLIKHSNLGLVIVSSESGAETNKMNIGFVRRFNNPDGSFAGVVQAMIPVERFSEMFSWFHPGPNGEAIIYSADHRELIHYPIRTNGQLDADDKISAQTIEMIDKGVAEASYVEIMSLSHAKRISSIRKIGTYSLYSMVAYAEQDYLSQWHKDAVNLSLFAVIFLILLTAAARQTSVQVELGRKSEMALQRSHERYAAVVNNVPWGVFILRITATGRMSFEYASTRMCQLLELSFDELCHDAASAFKQVHPDDVDELLILLGYPNTSTPFRWKGRIKVGDAWRVFSLEAVPALSGGADGLWNGVLADITEQELAERRLRESDEKLRSLYELSPLGIALTSPDGHFIEFNESFREITGRSEQDLLNLEFWELTPESYKDEELKRKIALENVGFYGPYRKEYLRQDGQLVPVQLNSVKIIGADGISYTWSIVENISERLHAEEQLRLSLERFRLMTSGVKDYAFYMLDAEGKVLNWNEGAERLMQFSADEIIGQPLVRFAENDDAARQRIAALLKSVNESGLAEDAGCWWMRRDGTTFWANVTLSCVRNSQNDVSGYVIIIRDISEHKQAQDTIRLTEVLFEKSLEGITIADQDGNLVDVNQAFLKTTGYTRDEVIGKNPRFLRSPHHDDSFYAAMWQTINLSGHWVGEIWNKRKSGEIYPDLLSITAITNDQGRVTNYLGVSTDLSRMKSHERQLERATHYDLLTGTANRVLLADRMEYSLTYAKRDQSLLAICYLDLDGFKPINDKHGHVTGDRLLVEVAKRIQSCVRGTDTVARLGGDEFVVMLVGLHRVDECTSVLEMLLKSIANPIYIDAVEFSLSASIGVSISQSGDGDSDTLLRHADKAMYVAKDTGRNRYHFYDPSQDILTREHFQSLKRMTQALENNEFELYYQPKVDMHTNQVVGVEALIRWNHPERGLVPPLEFLPIIEGSELEIPLGDWVIDAALRQLETWQKIGLSLEISINISARHLQSNDFIADLRRRLSAYPTLPPGLLEIEILETAALQDLGKAKAIITECNKMGVGFALDDFGTGYSSLTYLRSIPAGTIKIDQTFVRDMLEDQGDRAIVDGIIVLARAFDLKVVAEGVETTEHYRALVKMGCQIGQGYGIARPMPVDKFYAWYLTLSDNVQPIFAR